MLCRMNSSCSQSLYIFTVFNIEVYKIDLLSKMAVINVMPLKKMMYIGSPKNGSLSTGWLEFLNS